MNEFNITIDFAKRELTKYLETLKIDASLELCLFKDKGIEPPVEDSNLDDGYRISVKDRSGCIIGTNSRSVLMGVYRLLSEWGIKFIRPGKFGTVYPKNVTTPDVDIQEIASTRHRTMCIEGAVSYQHVFDMIDWLPKCGFNGYYIQFSDSYIFFDRWYAHRGNPYKEAEPLDYSTCNDYVSKLISEIKKRGLMLHRMGHGWTCDPFGVVNHGWDPVPPSEIPDSYRRVCAEVGGKRDVWKNMPVATQLCLTDDTVRQIVSDYVIKYAEDHPEVDVLHFWMGDHFNNTCECHSCRDVLPSDAYVSLTNMITEGLEKRGINTIIVITCSYNFAYAPKKEKLSHPDKVILMFAPISRTFAKSFPETFIKKDTPEYKLNSFNVPRDVDQNLAYLYQWKKSVDCTAVDFDYHLMWDHILDAGAEGLARVIYDDVRNLKSLFMDGFISCQLQRNAFPSALCLNVLGKTLWNRDSDFNSIRNEVYSATYGEQNVEKMINYFTCLSRGFDIGALRSQRYFDPEERKEFIVEAIKAIDETKDFILSSSMDEVLNEAQRNAFLILSIHGEMYKKLGLSILERLRGNEEEADRLRMESVSLAFKYEDVLSPVLDTFFYDLMTKLEINLFGEIPFSDT